MTPRTLNTFRFVTAPGPGNPSVNDLAADGGRLVVAADDGRIRLVDLAGRVLTLRETIDPPGERILSNAIDIVGDVVAVGNHHGQLLRYCLRSWGPTSESLADLASGPVNAVVVLPQSGLVVAGCYSGSISVVAPSGDVVSNIALGRGAVKSIALADANNVVVATAGGDLGRVDIAAMRVAWFTGHDAIVNDVSLGPDFRSLVSVGRDFTIRWTDIWTGKLKRVVPLEQRSPKAVLLGSTDTAHVADYWGWVTAVHAYAGVVATCRVSMTGVSCLVRVGDLLVAGSYDGSLTLLDPTTLETVDRLSLGECSAPSTAIRGPS